MTRIHHGDLAVEVTPAPPGTTNTEEWRLLRFDQHGQPHLALSGVGLDRLAEIEAVLAAALRLLTQRPQGEV